MQRLAKFIAWTAAGAFAAGAGLDALLNAGQLFTPRRTVLFTAILFVIWAALELFARFGAASWYAQSSTGPRVVRISGIGPRTRAAMLGVLILLWAAQAVRHGVGTDAVAANVAENLTLTCSPRPRFAMLVAAEKVGPDDALTKTITLECDIANIGRERLSVVTGQFTVDYKAPSGSTIPLESGPLFDASVRLPELPFTLDAGEVRRFSLDAVILRDRPDHAPALALDAADGKVLFPPTWGTKFSSGRPVRVEKHYLSGISLTFATSRNTSARERLSLAELESR